MSKHHPPATGRREGLVLGSVRGTPVILAHSWFVIAAVTVLIFGPQLQTALPGLGGRAYLVAFAYALLLLFSVFVHELAHAVAAKAYRWPTHKIVLNLWGGHTEFDFSTATPGRALVVAYAGPASNFVLAGLGYGLQQVLTPDDSSLALVVMHLLLSIFIWANVLLGVFNVLPGLPLDGGRLVESLVWKATGNQERGTVAAGWAGRILVLLGVAAALLLLLVRGGTPSLTTVFLVALMAGFLWMGASSALQGARLRLRLPAITATSLATPAVGVPAASSVAQLWSVRAAHPSAPIVLCLPDGRPAAVVEEQALAAVPPALAVQTPGEAVARRLSAGAHVPETALGADLVRYLSQLPDTAYAVVDDRGQVTGLLEQATILAALTGATPARGTSTSRGTTPSRGAR